METKEYKLEDWQDFIGYLAKPSAGEHAKGFYKNFHKCSTWVEATRLAIEGWKDGIKQVEAFSSLLDSELKGSLMIDEYYYDVTGQDFDLDRVILGEPECWLASEQVEVKAPATHTVKLVVNGATNYGITPNQMIARGSTLIALVQLLERGRKRVEIELIFNVEANSKTFRISVPLKSASSDIDLGKVTFALAHPDCCRRFQFAVWDALEADNVGKRGHGSPIDLQLLEQEKEGIGIYIGQGYRECNFEDFYSSKRWILDRLKEQGVELKEEGV
jgi:hypothetical protein